MQSGPCMINRFQRLEDGPIDEIDAALFTGDMFFDKDNISALRSILARWERRLVECESIAEEINEQSN